MSHRTMRFLLCFCIATLLAACGAESPSPAVSGSREDAPAWMDNPWLAPNPLPLNYPPFDRLEPEMLLPALDAALDLHRREVEAIASQPVPPDFRNTLIALELAGQTLDRLVSIFEARLAADGTDAWRALAPTVRARLVTHDDAIVSDPRVFARIAELQRQREDLGLDPESLRLLDHYHRDFVRAGAQLTATDQARLRNLDQTLAELELSYIRHMAEPGNPDNAMGVSRILRLRAEKARMLGAENWAEFVLATQMAGTAAAVAEHLQTLLAPTLTALQPDAGVAGAAPVPESDQALTDAALRPYFELQQVLTAGVFRAATDLFGLQFVPRPDLPVYHPDVQVFEVFDAAGTTLGIFLADYLARPTKQPGAWTASYVTQSGLTRTRAVVANHLNLARPAAGEPILLSPAEVRTLFHEFGHALQALFSDVEFPYFAGTRVPLDFIEFPAQLNEIWATWPSVLDRYARHWQTGEPMPAALRDRFVRSVPPKDPATLVGQLGAALLDLAAHSLTPDEVPGADDIAEFEMQTLRAAGIDPDRYPPRYRLASFGHIMGGYDAGYYRYTWTDMLDADATAWLHAQGGLTRANGNHLRRTLLSRGGSRDVRQQYRDFRGGDAGIESLLVRHGLMVEEP